MQKPTLTTLLAAGVIGTMGSFALAQDAGMNDQSATDQSTQTTQTDQAFSEHSAQAQGQHKEVHGQIVSLKAYLLGQQSMLGEQNTAQAGAAGSSTAQSSASTTGSATDRPLGHVRASMQGPQALVADDGTVYILLNQPGQSAMAGQASSSWSSNQSATQADAGGQTGEVQTDQMASAQEKNESLSDILGDTNAQENAESTGTAQSNQTDQSDVYGMNQPRAHAWGHGLKIGERVTLTGIVYERDGIRGLHITKVQTNAAGLGSQQQPDSTYQTQQEQQQNQQDMNE